MSQNMRCSRSMGTTSATNHVPHSGKRKSDILERTDALGKWTAPTAPSAEVGVEVGKFGEGW